MTYELKLNLNSTSGQDGVKGFKFTLLLETSKRPYKIYETILFMA